MQAGDASEHVANGDGTAGFNGLAVGNDGPQAVVNPSDEDNETADPANDAKSFAAYGWTTAG